MRVEYDHNRGEYMHFYEGGAQPASHGLVCKLVAERVHFAGEVWVHEDQGHQVLLRTHRGHVLAVHNLDTSSYSALLDSIWNVPCSAGDLEHNSGCSNCDMTGKVTGALMWGHSDCPECEGHGFMVAKEEPEPGFRAGDRVEWVTDPGRYGTVVSIDGPNPRVVWDGGNGTEYLYRADSLAIVCAEADRWALPKGFRWHAEEGEWWINDSGIHGICEGNADIWKGSPNPWNAETVTALSELVTKRNAEDPPK